MAGQKNSRSQSLPTTSNNPAAILLDWLPVAGTTPASAQALRTNVRSSRHLIFFSLIADLVKQNTKEKNEQTLLNNEEWEKGREYT